MWDADLPDCETNWIIYYRDKTTKVLRAVRKKKLCLPREYRTTVATYLAEVTFLIENSRGMGSIPKLSFFDKVVSNFPEDFDTYFHANFRDTYKKDSFLWTQFCDFGIKSPGDYGTMLTNQEKLRRHNELTIAMYVGLEQNELTQDDETDDHMTENANALSEPRPTHIHNPSRPNHCIFKKGELLHLNNIHHIYKVFIIHITNDNFSERV